jgi:hypothetical protein
MDLRMTEKRRLDTAAPAMRMRMMTRSRVLVLLLLPNWARNSMGSGPESDATAIVSAIAVVKLAKEAEVVVHGS